MLIKKNNKKYVLEICFIFAESVIYLASSGFTVSHAALAISIFRYKYSDSEIFFSKT